MDYLRLLIVEEGYIPGNKYSAQYISSVLERNDIRWDMEPVQLSHSELIKLCEQLPIHMV